VGDISKCRKKPPLARISMQGRWWWWESCQNAEKNHLRLTFQCEGGGGGIRIETSKWTTSGSRLEAREVGVVGGTSKRRNEPPPARIWTQGRWWWWDAHRNAKMDHVQLAFGHEGGGSGGVRVEMLKRTTSGSRLDAREVVVVEFTSKCRNQPPLARVWTRGRWWW